MSVERIAHAIARRSRPGAVWSLITTCPFGCKHPHIHGGGTSDVPEGGHVVAHCPGAAFSSKNRGYTIVITAIVDGAGKKAAA